MKSQTRRSVMNPDRSRESDAHAEVGDEGRLWEVHFKEDLIGDVGFVQGFGGHDGVSEARRHRAVHGHTVHLHLRATETHQEETHQLNAQQKPQESLFNVLVAQTQFSLCGNRGQRKP